MKTKYLSYIQACELAGDFQYLTGTEIGDGHRADLIVVAPYSRILQWNFARQLLSTQEPTLTINNPSGRYDVLVISLCRQAPGGFVIKDLRSCLKSAGIIFELDKYSNLYQQKTVTKVSYTRQQATLQENELVSSWNDKVGYSFKLSQHSPSK